MMAGAAGPAAAQQQGAAPVEPYKNPEIANLPGWVIALVAAGGLAAALRLAVNAWGRDVGEPRLLARASPDQWRRVRVTEEPPRSSAGARDVVCDFPGLGRPSRKKTCDGPRQLILR